MCWLTELYPLRNMASFPSLLSKGPKFGGLWTSNSLVAAQEALETLKNMVEKIEMVGIETSPLFCLAMPIRRPVELGSSFSHHAVMGCIVFELSKAIQEKNKHCCCLVIVLDLLAEGVRLKWFGVPFPLGNYRAFEENFDDPLPEPEQLLWSWEAGSPKTILEDKNAFFAAAEKLCTDSRPYNLVLWNCQTFCSEFFRLAGLSSAHFGTAEPVSSLLERVVIGTFAFDLQSLSCFESGTS